MAKLTQEYILKVVASGLKEVTKEIQTLNANLTGVEKSTGKVTKSFGTAGKAQDNYSKKAKGVGELTNNQTKSFSKMAQGMSGTLVPAYATVAANVFALTAAFGALKRATDLEILIKSAETFAVQTGRSLTQLSRNMKAITADSITMKESLVSASLAVSAGFDDTSIENLTKVARNASVALGRDLSDSMDRVFKGAIKAEPELLDELGLVLRLDTAARKYAATLGKTAKALTTFEKQQAVLNEVVRQGNEKFEIFADVDINPYTRLSAAFQDISENLIGFISTPLTPVLKFFADNISALTTVIVLFSTSILTKAFPALGDFANLMETKLVSATATAAKALKVAEESNVSFKQSLQATSKESVVALDTFSKGIYQVQNVVERSGKVISKSFKEAFTIGTDKLAGIQAYKKGIQGVLIAFKRGAKVSQGFDNTDENVQFLNEELAETKAVLSGIEKKTISVQNKMQAFSKGASEAFAKVKANVVSFGATVAKSATSGALAGYTEGFKGIASNLKVISLETKGFTKVTSLATAGITGMGGAFLKMIPVIGQIVFAWSLLSAAFTFLKDFIVGKSLVDLSKTLDDNTEALNTAAKSAEYYNNKLKDLPSTLDNINKRATLLSNTMGNLANKLTETLKDINIDKGFSGFDSFLDALALGNLDEFKDQLDSVNKTMKRFGFEKESNDILKEFTNLLRLNGEEAIKAGEALTKRLTIIASAARGELELNKLLSDSLVEISKGLTQLQTGLPALNGVERAFFSLNTLLSGMDTKNIQLVVSSIEDLNNFDLRQLGLTEIADNIANIKQPVDILNKQLAETKKRLEAIEKERKNATEIGGMFEISTFKNTEGEFNLLSNKLLAVQGGIDGITFRLKDQSAGIIKQLNIVKDRFQAIVNAQREIADIRSKNAVSNLEEGKGLEKRLSLLKNITDAENKYLTTITEQTTSNLNEITKSISDTEAQLARASDKGQQASLLKELETDKRTQQQLENKLLTDRNKIVGNYIKQVTSVQKELNKTTKFAAAGLTVSEDQARILQNELYQGYLNIATAQGKNVELAKSFALEMTASAVAVQDFNAFLQQTRMPSLGTLVSDLTSLNAREESLRLESEYLNTSNVALSERIDKEFILSKAINDRLTLEAENKVTKLTQTDPKGAELASAAKLLNALNLKGAKLDKIREKSVALITKTKLKGLTTELKLSKDILKLGVIYTKAQLREVKLEQTLQKLRDKGFIDVNKNFKDLIKQQEKADFSTNFNDGISSMIDGMSDFNGIMNDLNNNLDMLGDDQKAVAGMKALSDIAEKTGNGVSKSFADMGILIDSYSDKLADGSMSSRDWSNMTMSALGAMSQMFDEGSKAAKALQIAQQALAIVNAVSSIAAAASSGDPYTAPARVAQMLGLMSSVLGMAGLTLGGASDPGAGAADSYKESISTQGLVGQRDLQSNSLIDSIEGLVSIETDLFSTNRELQLTLVKLNNNFSKIGASLFGEAGSFESGNVVDLFGTSFGSSGSKNLFGGSSTSKNLVDAGLQLSSSVASVGNNIVTSLDSATLFLVESVTRTTSSWFGLVSSTSTTLNTVFRSIGNELRSQLSNAISSIGPTLGRFFESFGGLINLNISALFGSLSNLSFDNLKLSLTGKSASEQSDTIAAFVSLMSTTIIEQLVPLISTFSRSGEELIDTLLRITESVWKLEASFNTLGASISSYIDTTSLDNLQPDNASVASAVEALKISLLAAWEDAFLSNFKDFEDFSNIFSLFSTAIYTDTELAQLALENATAVVDSGFENLRNSLASSGQTDLLTALGTGNTESAIKSVFELGNEIGAFAVRFDTETGKIDTTGADLLALVIELGAAMGMQQQATEALIEPLANLNNQYERQIALFGLLDKELELLSLSFDFQDALAEAKETGTDLALVETYYGLLRLDIYKKYNQEILDSLKETMSNISDSILEVLKSADGWSELSYQSIKVNKLVNKLSQSLGNLSSSIDFSVFSDVTDTTEFLNTLEQFIDTTIGSANSISEQIGLVESLREAVMARYSAEVAANEDIQSSIIETIDGLKNLSLEIKGFLDDLFIGDLSPLTGAQKLAEAQTQFDENLKNVLSQDTALADAAREDLLNSASTLLELASVFWAIGPEYQSIFNNVVGSLESIDQNIVNQLTLSEETLAINSLEASLTDLQLQTIGQLQTLDDILLVLNDQNTINLANELSTGMPEVNNNLTAILNKLSQVNDDTWNPIYLQLVNLNTTMSNFTGGIGSYAKGAEEINYDQVAMIHKGETILTADTANAIRNGDSIYGSTDVIAGATSSTNTGGNSDVVDAIRILTQVVSTGQEDIIDKNEEVRQATLSNKSDLSIVASAKGIV